MKDFIIDLYSNDNFTLWLTIALVVLIVLFFGKKDKKLQETQKLAKVSDGFKEETKAEPVEVTATPEAKEEAKAIPEPTTEVTMEVVEPTIANSDSSVSEEKVAEAKEETETEETDDDFTIPEVKEIAFDEINNSLEKELSELENLKNEFNNIELPKTDDIIKPADAPEASKPVEEKEESQEEVKEPAKTSPQVFSSVFVNKEEDDMELPTLKEEPKKEEKVPSTNFDLNNLNGESYDLNDK